MSTTRNKLDVQRLTVQNNVLPPTFMQTFYIDKEHVKCVRCNFLCKHTTHNTFFHLTVCNGSLVEENVKNYFKLNCLMCNFSTKNIDVWKNHLFNFQHISKLNLYLYATKYSYDCNLCKNHFYGSEDEILKHPCKPKKLSMLSKFMAYVYYHFDIHNKRMLYYCADCEYYSYALADLHIKKHCKAINNQDNFVCNSCLITYYSCKDSFTNHKVSFQHLALWCLNGYRSKPKTLASMHWKLPSYMSNFFIVSTVLQKVSCVVCDEVIVLNYDCIYNHFIECISSKDVSENDKNTPLRLLICSLCTYQYSSSEEDLYKVWVQHVISLDHLKKTKLKSNQFNLFTYYCFVSETVYYGTDSFITQQILKNNIDIGRLLFISKVMAQVYKLSNTYLYKIEGKTLYVCGFCERFTDNQSEYCEHANIKSNQIFSCSSCLVVFNVKSDYIEHLISSEHIILRYFKPNQLSEFKILEYSMNTLKMNKSNLIVSDDDSSASLSDKNSLDELSIISLSDSVELECKDQSSKTTSDVTENDLNAKSDQSQLPSTDLSQSQQCAARNTSSHRLIFNTEYTENNELCNLEMDISNFIKKLNVQSKNSAFNNHLRMNFELLNQMALSMNDFVELKSFFCSVCNIIYSDLLRWTQHIIEFHIQFDVSVFYCDICQIYQVGTSSSNSKHSETVEHNVMSKFQEYIKKNKHLIINNGILDKNSITANDDAMDKKECKYNDNNSNSSDDSIPIDNVKHDMVSKSQEYLIYIKKKSLMNTNISHDVLTANGDNSINTKDKRQMNNTVYIEFQGVSKNFRLKKFRLLRRLLRENYGNFEKISSTKNSFIILFYKMKVSNRLIKDQQDLTNEHGLTFKVIIYNNDKFKNFHFMTDWCMICTQTFDQLDKINEHKSQTKINELYKSIRNLNIDFTSFNIYMFESEGYELATDKCDVDLYLEKDDTYDWDINRANSLVKNFARQLDFKPEEFKDILKIRDVRGLVVKCYHIPTSFNCNIYFNGDLAFYNTKLIKSYLSIDPTVKWLVSIIIKNWAVKNNLININMFSEHQMIWLVLFYLIDEKVVPSIFELVVNTPLKDHKIVEGWDCTFVEWSGSIQDHYRPKLLLGFFHYYTNIIKLRHYVLSTFLGKCLKKDKFFTKFSKLPEINENQYIMFKTHESNIRSNFQNNHRLAIQDPFKLSCNLTENISDDTLTNFCDLCDKTIMLLTNTKCFNTF